MDKVLSGLSFAFIAFLTFFIGSLISGNIEAVKWSAAVILFIAPTIIVCILAMKVGKKWIE